MSKGLEALEKLYNYPNLKYRNEIVYLLEQDNLPIYREIIKKELKALEIIKSFEVLSVFEERGKYYFVVNGVGFETTKEEYDLLKEVLL